MVNIVKVQNSKKIIISLHTIASNYTFKFDVSNGMLIAHRCFNYVPVLTQLWLFVLHISFACLFLMKS